jgi:hypothetical protein
VDCEVANGPFLSLGEKTSTVGSALKGFKIGERSLQYALLSKSTSGLGKSEVSQALKDKFKWTIIYETWNVDHLGV